MREKHAGSGPGSMRWGALVLSGSLVLQSCAPLTSTVRPTQRTFERTDQAARVIVGVQSVAPFEDYVDSLQPKFQLSADLAFQEAVAQSQIQELEELKAIVLEAAIGLPVSRRSSSQSISERSGFGDGEDGSRSEETRTSERESPEPKEQAIPERLARVLDGLDPGSNDFKLDPALRYRAAAALMQEVALLSNYVKDAAVSREAIPYVVRLLITVFPTARREPYDIYTTIGFFGGEPSTFVDAFASAFGAAPDRESALRSLKNLGSLSGAGNRVDVVPLFVTDNLETSWLSSSRSATRDLGASVGGAGPSVSGALGIRSQKEATARSLSRDLNSLFTVGRVTENAVEVRIGAATVDGTYQLVPRTFNLTALVLVPRVLPTDVQSVVRSVRVPEEGSADRNIEAEQRTREAAIERIGLDALPLKSVRYVANTEVRNADTGVVLAAPSFEDLAKVIEAELDLILPSSVAQREAASINPSMLLENALAGDYSGFLLGTSLQSDAPFSSMIWTRLARVVASSGYTTGSFPIYRPRLRYFDSDPRIWNQADWRWESLAPPVAVDDGKVLRLRLTGAQGLSNRGFSARLEFALKDQSTSGSLAATSVSVEEEGRTAVVEFPSIAEISDSAKPLKIAVSYQKNYFRWLDTSDTESYWDWYRDDIPLVVIKKDDKTPSAGAQFKASTSSLSIRTVSPGNGQLAIWFERNKGEKVAAFEAVRFSLKGAHVVSAAPPLETADGAYVAKIATRYLLTLGGLIPGSSVTVESWRMEAKAKGDADSKKTEPAAVAAPSLELAVVGPEIAPRPGT